MPDKIYWTQYVNQNPKKIFIQVFLDTNKDGYTYAYVQGKSVWVYYGKHSSYRNIIRELHKKFKNIKKESQIADFDKKDPFFSADPM